MGKENAQKIKLLLLYEYLKQNSCEEKPITTIELLDTMDKMGIKCTRKTIANDIDVLNNYGFEIMSRMVGHKKGYYVEDRSFDISELKVLVDAIHASSFITEKKSNELIEKISNLGGSHHSEILKDSLVCFNTRKHSNEQIFYNVRHLEEAIRKGKKISFLYFDLNENAKKVYRKNKEKYISNPMALIFKDDNYYLMCYSDKYNKTNNYRVDRMESVNILKENVCKEAIIVGNELSTYTEQVFRMYSVACRLIEV